MSKLSQVEKDAKRRIHIVTPENAVKVLSKDIYWTVPFLQLYLDRCEVIGAEEPDRGLLMATHGPELARRIATGDRPGSFANRKERASYLVMTLAMLAGMNRRSGKMSEARGVYAHAFEIVESEDVSQYARADLLWRFGRLQSATDSEAALDSLNESASIFMKIKDRNGLARALMGRASVYCREGKWSMGATELRRVCDTADEKTIIGRLALDAAVLNLSFAVANGGVSLDVQSDILKFLAAIRARLAPKRFSHTRARLYWMEGLLHRNLHFLNQAERVLERARRSFIKLGDCYDFVLVTIDLAQLLMTDGEVERYEQLQLDTIAALKEMAAPEDLEEALTQWRRRPHTEKALSETKQQIINLR